VTNSCTEERTCVIKALLSIDYIFAKDIAVLLSHGMPQAAGRFF
jgi:hypothetical protein